MKFRTEIKDLRYPIVLDPCKPVVLIGSCFAGNIATKMRECEWAAFNDAGTLYNPLSIAKVLELLVFRNDFEEELQKSLFDSSGITHSWLFDSHFSHPMMEEVISKVNKISDDLADTLQKSQVLIVTFGTAWCYFLEDNPTYVVSNCHKQPPTLFIRRRISVDEIVREWKQLAKKLKTRFPQLSFIFTVSPVRHLKDGFEGNSRSKATLLLAVEEICKEVPDAFYFPAYEIVCDDLRDYRFYASDLVHPSESAVEYIWEIFRSSFLNGKGEEMLRIGNRHYKAANHRPIMSR